MRPATPSASWAIRPPSRTIVLLGHIDTVPGNIPVRIEPSADGDLLYGRGSVDAKGPLATFVAGAARFGAARARAAGLRVVVVGAVEEEAATSKGARFIASRFNGTTEPIPTACIIGEPSHWNRVTLGYKGRLLLDLTADQPMAHTAGPDASVASVVVDLWNWVTAHAAAYNAGQGQGVRPVEPEPAPVHHLDQRRDARHGRRAVCLAPAGGLRRRCVHAGAAGLAVAWRQAFRLPGG